MGKYSTKKIHFNPKKKKPNKNHKQKYFKKENKPIDKTNFYVVNNKREELAPYVGDEFEVYGFVTNSTKYNNQKRLLTSVIFPIFKDGKKLYVSHIWVRTEKTDHVPHGFKTLKVKVIEYPDLYNGGKKYGVKFIKVVKWKQKKD